MDFATEAALCRHFRQWAEGKEYETDSEFFGWDVKLTDLFGKVMGVEAKLDDPMLAIAQCVERMVEPKVDTCAILLPKVTDSARRLCLALGYGYAYPVSRNENDTWNFHFEKPKDRKQDLKKPLTPNHRFKNETPAGVPSPRVMNTAKEKELRLLAIFKRKGWLNTKDFQSVGMSTRYLPPWLYRDRSNHFVQVIGSELPDEFHPIAAKQLAKEMR